MKNKWHIALIASAEDCSVLAESVRSVVSTTFELVELICCEAGSTLARLALAGADGVIVGASIEVAADDQKLLQILQTIEEQESDGQNHALLAALTWGAHAAKLASRLKQPALLSPDPADHRQPDLQSLQTRLQNALPALPALTSETRYYLMSAAMDTGLTSTSQSSAHPIVEEDSTDALKDDSSGFFGAITGFFSSEKKELKQEAQSLRMTVKKLRQEHSEMLRRQRQLEMSLRQLKTILNSMEIEKEQLANELEALYQQFSNEREEAQQQLGRTKESLARANAQLETREAQHQQNTQSLVEKLQQKDRELEAASERLNVFKQNHEALLLELQNALSAAEAVQAEVRSAREALAHSEQRVTDALQEAADAQAALTLLQNQQTRELPHIETSPLSQAVFAPVTNELVLDLPAELFSDCAELNLPEPDFPEFISDVLKDAPVTSDLADESVAHELIDAPVVLEPVMPAPPVSSVIAQDEATQPDHIRLSDLVEELKRKMAPLLPGKKISLSSEIDEAVQQIQANEMLLRQILSNLMSEAVISTKEGAVMINARRIADTISISVSDTGTNRCGDKRGSTGRLNRKQSDEQSIESDYSAVRALAEKMNGKLRVRFIPNFGTTVSLLLQAKPVVKAMGKGTIG